MRRAPSIWFHDRDGKIDPILTFAFFAVIVILFKLLFAGASVDFGPHFKFAVTAPDATVIAAAWAPTLGAYVTNKYVNYQYHPDYIKMKKDIDGDGDEEEIIVKKDEIKTK